MTDPYRRDGRDGLIVTLATLVIVLGFSLAAALVMC
jgi:hypothetical protein